MQVQRLTQYETYFQSLLDETRPEHGRGAEYHDLCMANSAVKQTVKRIHEQSDLERIQDVFPNDFLRLYDKEALTMKMKGLIRKRGGTGTAALRRALSSKSLRSESPPSTPNKIQNDSPRKFIMETPVQFVNGVHCQERHLFLFNDLLLVAKAKSGSNFKLKDKVRISEIWLNESPAVIDEVAEIPKSSDTSFVIGWPTTNYVAVFRRIKRKVLQRREYNEKLQVKLLLPGLESGWDSNGSFKYKNRCEENNSTQATRNLWWSKLAEESQEEIRKDPPTTNVQVFYQDLNTGIEYCKTFAIGPDESAKDCIKIALDHLEMRDVDPSQYQLWAKTPREEPPYPLFGHEKPYSVKLSCLRDGLSAEEGFDLDHCNNVHDPLARCHFILRYDITDQILYNYISYYCITALPGTSARPQLIKPSPSYHYLSVKAQENETNKKTPKKSSSRMKIGQVFKKTPTKDNGGNLFGVPLNRICDGENLPKPVMGMLHQIFSKGPFTQGIFRKSANARLVRELREKMDVCEDVCLENVPVLVTAALFKDMLRSLPDPLLCTNLFPKWRSALDCSNLPTKLFRIKTIIDQLPKPNYHLLCHFLCVLYHISRRSTHNLMSAANLGVCVGPSLLWSDSPAMCPTEDLRTVPALVEILITHCELLCGPHVPNLLGDPRDSGTEESDSMRRDDSSIDSLEVSPPPRKDQISLSRDSGLTMSDSQLYTPDEEESGSTSSSGYDPAFDQAHSAKTAVSATAVPSMPGEYVRVYPGWEERKNANFQRQAWFRQRSKRLTAAASKEAVRRSASEESVLDGNVPPPTPPRRSKPVQTSGSNNINNNNNNRISLPPQQDQYRKMTAADYYDVVVKSEVVVDSLHPNNYNTELTIKPVLQQPAVTYRNNKDESPQSASPVIVARRSAELVDRRRYLQQQQQQQPHPQQQQQLTAATSVTATATTTVSSANTSAASAATATPADNCCDENEEDSSTLSDEDCTPHVSRSNSRGNEVATDSLKLRQHQPLQAPAAHADGTVRLRGRLKRKEEKAAVAAARSRSLPPPPPYRPPPPANRRAPITSYYLGECSQAQQQRFVVTRTYADEESYV
ncbi:hypothetical protein AGLY_007011 [Aphis glycines]|uniref:Rho-GAP domain-containing protein n=1 Tax=Aphis glycines TaxID=307491 RepID=A0A6G0TQA0_APHGL|nr:hypothetical protein AGLY_007011 [Aphis glycines]